MNMKDMLQAVQIYSSARLAQKKIFELPASCKPTNTEEAYQLQAQLNSDLELADIGKVAGYKIGCTSKVMQDYLNIDEPCSGAIYTNTVYNKIGTVPYSSFCKPGVECEIAVRLGEDLKPEKAPYDSYSVTAAIEDCMVAIEIVDDRFMNFRKLDVFTMLADDFFNAGCVLGPPVKLSRELKLENLYGEMHVNGTKIGSGYGRDVMGHPFNVVAWLANSFINRGRMLRKGEFILTGSLVETYWCSTNDNIDVSIDGLGEVSLRFSAT